MSDEPAPELTNDAFMALHLPTPVMTATVLQCLIDHLYVRGILTPQDAGEIADKALEGLTCSLPDGDVIRPTPAERQKVLWLFRGENLGAKLPAAYIER